jgi:hypothetical protein
VRQRLKDVTREAETAGRISREQCLRNAQTVAKAGSQEARRSVGNLCLAVISADKSLREGEIPLITCIWKTLSLELGALVKALEKLIRDDDGMSEAVEAAGVDASMPPTRKLELLKRRYGILNARMQALRDDDLVQARTELGHLVRATQLYRDLVDNVH